MPFVISFFIENFMGIRYDVEKLALATYICDVAAEFALEDITVTAVWDSSAEVPEKEEKPQIDLSTWVNPYGDVKETDWYYT